MQNFIFCAVISALFYSHFSIFPGERNEWCECFYNRELPSLIPAAVSFFMISVNLSVFLDVNKKVGY